jgi:acyl carrier protein
MTASPSVVLPAIAAAIRAVLRDTGREARSIDPAMLLTADLGLDSLDLAQAIVLLERSLGVDPFRTPPASGARPPLRSVADLVSIYASIIPGPDAGSGPSGSAGTRAGGLPPDTP